MKTHKKDPKQFGAFTSLSALNSYRCSSSLCERDQALDWSACCHARSYVSVSHRKKA